MKKEVRQEEKKIFADPILDSITHIDLAPIEPHGDIYGALLSSIISQQISTAAARSIKKKFTEYFGSIDKNTLSGKAVSSRYPTVDELLDISNEKLRELGLSTQKASYVKSVAEFFDNAIPSDTPYNPLTPRRASSESSPRGALSPNAFKPPLGEVALSDSEVAEGVVLHELPDEDMIKMLTQIKGVGRWTVEMILIFTLGRPDVFAIDDLGLQQSVIELYKLRKTKTLKKRMLAISARWSPNRSLASRYLWAWRDRLIR